MPKSEFLPGFSAMRPMLVAAIVSLGIVALQYSGLRPAADDPALLSWAVAGSKVSPDWSPLYVLLLRAAYLLCGDPQIAFKSAVSLISVLGAAAVFCWIWRCSANSSLAAFSAIFYLASGFSPAASTTEQSLRLIVSSVAGHFALCFVLLGLICLGAFATRFALAICSMFLLLATYCRPEFLLSSVVCLLGAAVVALRYRRVDPVGSVCLLLTAAVWIGLPALWGVPLPTTQRAFIAFGQHAGLSFCAIYNSFCPTNFWLEYPTYVDKLFPGAHSVSGAIWLDPVSFSEHVIRNLLISVLNVLTAAFGFAGLSNLSVGSTLFEAAMLSWLCLIIYRTKRGASATDLVDRGRGDPMVFVIAAFVVVPQLSNWLLLYPRLHYMVVPVIVTAGIVLLRFRVGARPGEASRSRLIPSG